MYYKRLLTLSASVILLAGCAATHTQHSSSTPQATKKGDIKHVAPDTKPSVRSASSSTDVSATYSTTTGDGTMMQTSVSAPIQQEGGSESTAVAVPTSTTNVPSIPNATKTASTPAHQGSSLATGFSLDMPYDDAWPKVRKALPAAGYSVMEKDELTGTYYVLDKIGSGGKIERDTPIYQVRLTKVGDASTKVMLLDSASQPASSGVSNRILGALKNKLD